MKDKKESLFSRIRNSSIFSIAVVLIISLLFFSFASKFAFLAPVNLKNIFNSMVITGFLTIAAGYVIITGEIDLSSGYVGTMCAVLLAALSTNAKLPIGWSVLVVFAAAALLGILNATLIHVFKFQSFIATLATGMVCKGLSLLIGNGQTVPLKNEIINYLGSGKIMKIVPVAIFLLIAFFIVYGIILSKTGFGRSIYLIGGNPNAARLAGLKPTQVSFIVFINSAILSAIAGCLAAGRMKGASAVGINGQAFDGVIAAILGGVTFGGGGGTMGGSFLGLLIINTFTNGMQILGLSSSWMTFATGALLLLAIIMDNEMNKRKFKKRS